MSVTYDFTVTRTDQPMARSSFRLTEDQMQRAFDRAALIEMYVQAAIRGLYEVTASNAPEIAGAA